MGLISRVAVKFANQLLELYNSKEYHILDLFRMYKGFLTKFGGYTEKNDLRRCTPWQMEDMEMSIWNDKIDYTKIPLETVHNRNRRSAKTKNFTEVAVFCALLNKEVKWRSTYSAQQNMAKIWYLLNPFVHKINNLENNVYLLGPSIYPINLGVLSAANVTGVECDVAMFDEGSWAFKHLHQYDAYKQARPMVSTSKWKHIMHFSTPARYSAFQEAWLEVESFAEEIGTTLTVLRTWKDCHWITPEFLEYEERMHIEDPSYIDQNYKGVWVVRGGAVFNNFYDINDRVHVPKEIREGWNEIEVDKGGVDWNGEMTKHYLILGKVTPRYVFIKQEIKFVEIAFLKEWMHQVTLELEDDDPFSDEFADTAKEIGIIGSYYGWDMPHKMERVRQLKIRTVIIDKAKCPTTWKNFQEAGFKKISRNAELEKRPDQHGLDGALHMVHPDPGPVDYRRRPKRTQLIAPIRDEWY
ncbi:hypothetical protein LCGC14_1368130 [marine sediment metagenome]|uniref:Phage terminase large subunit N-terminal domain-containing protein n=2 Tax=marine sediment metagenome TaxID=412755 RepID=A0A0F9ML85_9ZZZZ